MAARLDSLRSIRKNLGKNQSELAGLLGVSTRALQSYEQGWRPTPPTVLRLAILLLYLKRRGGRRKPAPCWRVRGCDRALRERCPADQYEAGDLCWLVTGTCIAGRPRASWHAKLATCRKCDVVKRWLKP